MKKHLTKVAIFLLAGAVVNVAVAWGCAVWVQRTVQPWQYDPVANKHWHPYHMHWHSGPPPPVRGLLSVEAEQWWAGHAPGGFPVWPTAAAASSSFGMNKIVMWKPDPDSQRMSLGFGVLRSRTGWPVRSMEGAEWHGAAGRVTFGAAVDVPFGTGFLPLRPQWLGFTINTPFYATILWLISCGSLALWRVLLRLSRLRSGLCPQCAYPMGESAVCTECGNELPQRVRAVP